jgi:hypothetical protein
MDSHFSHLLLLIVIVQQLNESLFCVLGQINPECSMRVFATKKGLPAVVLTMKITTPAGSLRIDLQVASFANDDTDELFLIVPKSATQTCSLWTISMIR